MKSYIIKAVFFLVIAIILTVFLFKKQHIDFIYISFTIVTWLIVIIELLLIRKEYQKKN